MEEPSQTAGLEVTRVDLTGNEHIWRLRVDRPEARNALNLDVMNALGDWAEYLQMLAETDPALAILICGSGGHFIAGGDLKALARRDDKEGGSQEDERLARTMSHRMRSALSTLRSLPSLLITAADGYVIGGGAEVFIAGDLRVMSSNTRLRFAQVSLGLSTGWGGARRLAELIGRPQALALLLDGRERDATQCEQLQLTHRISLTGNAEQEAMKWIDELAKTADAVRSIKVLLGSSDAEQEIDQREAALFPKLWVGEEHWNAVQTRWITRRRMKSEQNERQEMMDDTSYQQAEERQDRSGSTQHRKRGYFIVFEGIDGAGTTTQAKRLVQWLQDQGRQAQLTMEPSEGELGILTRAALRGEIPGRGGRPLPAESFALLFAADRADHWYNEIEPLLEQGIDVISDRYLYSSIAYQGMELDESWVRALNARYPHPDLLLFVETSPEVAKMRRMVRGEEADRYEVDQLQIKIASRYERICLEAGAIRIQGNDPLDLVTTACLQAVSDLLKMSVQ